MMRGLAVSTLIAAWTVFAPDAWAQDEGGRFYGDRILRCESKDGEDNICPADIRGGVRLLRTLSRTDCDEHETWGVTSAGVWVKDGCRADFVLGYGGSVGSGTGSRVLRCESKGSRWTHCPAETRAGVELVRQLSKNPCMRGQNWGADARGVWVSGGCRAEFRMMVDVANETPRQIVRCDSVEKRPRHCPIGTKGDVRVFRQLSRAACVEGRTWGVDDNGIWVEGGCRAEFEIHQKPQQSDG
jgi:hypothetical protein